MTLPGQSATPNLFNVRVSAFAPGPPREDEPRAVYFEFSWDGRPENEQMAPLIASVINVLWEHFPDRRLSINYHENTYQHVEPRMGWVAPWQEPEA